MKKMFSGLVAVLFMFMVVACGDDPTLPSSNDNTDTSAEQPDPEPVVDEDTANEQEPVVDEDVTPDNGCATSNTGQNCDSDEVCGACMICQNGRCMKGCEADTDCSAYVGTRCNTKLARCVNPIASGQACSETSCPTGCCYAEKGLSGLRCATTPSIETCGMCPQGEIYSPEDNKCLTAACSTSTDNCPTLNASSTTPPSKCFECKEYICKANTSTSGCSAGTVINAAQCVPAGQQCVEGVSECCSGMPCVQGYCY